MALYKVGGSGLRYKAVYRRFGLCNGWDGRGRTRDKHVAADIVGEEVRSENVTEVSSSLGKSSLRRESSSSWKKK